MNPIRRVRRAYRKVKHWLTQSVAYSIFIWKNDNYDWDYGYLINLMRFKLSRMAKTIEENGIIEANHRVAKQIRYAIYLMDRWQNNVDMDRYKEEELLDRLFRHMRKYFQRWWD